MVVGGRVDRGVRGQLLAGAGEVVRRMGLRLPNQVEVLGPAGVRGPDEEVGLLLSRRGCRTRRADVDLAVPPRVPIRLGGDVVEDVGRAQVDLVDAIKHLAQVVAPGGIDHARSRARQGGVVPRQHVLPGASLPRASPSRSGKGADLARAQHMVEDGHLIQVAVVAVALIVVLERADGKPSIVRVVDVA